MNASLKNCILCLNDNLNHALCSFGFSYQLLIGLVRSLINVFISIYFDNDSDLGSFDLFLLLYLSESCVLINLLCFATSVCKSMLKSYGL